ncbi:MAG: restriction endonuclease [Clostridia bacterium]|nr:restriction endonuclease [Clostridia bacterium]
MEKKEKTENNKPAVTRAEKRDAVKNLIREILAKGNQKSNDLIDEAARLFAERFGGEDTPNDVKGRVGSVLDVMKKENEVRFDGGVYALKAETPEETVEEKPVKKTRKTTKKAAEEVKEEAKEEKIVKAKRTAKKKEEKTEPLPAAPLQPIAPTAPITPETAPEPIPEKEEKEEKAVAPKKRGRKPKTAETEEKVVAPVAVEEKIEEKTEEKPKEKPEEKIDASPKGTVMDMSFLFGGVKPAPQPVKKEEAPTETKPKAEEKKPPVQKEQPKNEQPKKEQPQKTEQKKTEPRKPVREQNKPVRNSGGRGRALTADEKLQEAFLNRLHRLGGEYFEYYSVYLLERYSRRNGRRLESLKITGGDHDGGIDGEIELTDKLGFRETIYIQSKNWDPDKGDEKLWVVGETLLQQFIGACVCRQAKEGKQHCRGIFITTSRFTPEAKKLLDDTSDKFVGYDGAELYETAKECEFGVIKKNGEWVLDEQLLSGVKAFFNMI